MRARQGMPPPPGHTCQLYGHVYAPTFLPLKSFINSTTSSPPPWAVAANFITDGGAAPPGAATGGDGGAHQGPPPSEGSFGLPGTGGGHSPPHRRHTPRPLWNHPHRYGHRARRRDAAVRDLQPGAGTGGVGDWTGGDGFPCVGGVRADRADVALVGGEIRQGPPRAEAQASEGFGCPLSRPWNLVFQIDLRFCVQLKNFQL